MRRTIIDKLADTLQRVELGVGGEPLTFVYADEGLQNIILEGVQMPFAAVVPITSSAVESEGGEYRERLTVAVFFGDLMIETGSDYNGIENERIIDVCKKRAFLWLASLNMPSVERGLKLVQVTSAERGYLRLDGNYTGFAVVVTFEELDGVGMCDWKAAIIPPPYFVEFNNKLWLRRGIYEIDGVQWSLDTRDSYCYIDGDLTRGSQIGSKKAPSFGFYIEIYTLPANPIRYIEITACVTRGTGEVCSISVEDNRSGDILKSIDVTEDLQTFRIDCKGRIIRGISISCQEWDYAFWLRSLKIVYMPNG